MKIVGKILYISYPKDGLFFNDIEWTNFCLQTDDNEKIYCRGKSFPLKKGFRVELEGDFSKSENGTKVFNFKVPKMNYDTKDSNKVLLVYCCGKLKATQLINHFGSPQNALEMVKKKPKRLGEINGFGPKVIQKIVDKFKALTEVQELYDDICKYGIEMEDANKIIKKIGKKEALEIINSNPYKLFNVCNFSFVKCDEIAIQRLNISHDNPSRISCGIFEILRQNFLNGNTYIFFEEFKDKTLSLLQKGEEKLEAGVFMEVYRELLSKEKLYEIDNKVFTRKSFLEKEDIRNFVFDSLKATFNSKVTISDIKEYEKNKGFTLGEEQIKAVMNSASNKLSVITGGPGTGKTTVLDCLLTIIRKRVPANRIALCSPTAKAARRMTESTGMPASTVHKLLEVNPEDGNLETFVFNEENKLPYEVVVIDESSMLDQFIAASIVRALKSNAQVIFVGDKNQLPPVGAGYFFRDLMNISQVPCVHLIKTYRQAGDSTIISLAQQIQNGFKIVKSKNDFGFRKTKNKDDVVDIFVRGANKVGIENIIVLSPQNKGELGTKSINNAILDIVVPKGEEIHKNGWTFREGARVMNTKNVNSLGLCNGQMGTITSIDFEDRILFVNFDGKEYEYDSDMLEHLVLGYCVTIHKSQGSEWRYVIEICSREHKFMNTKPLVYTGVTRAKEKLIIAGDLDIFLGSSNKMPREVLSQIV